MRVWVQSLGSGSATWSLVVVFYASESMGLCKILQAFEIEASTIKLVLGALYYRYIKEYEGREWRSGLGELGVLGLRFGLLCCGTTVDGRTKSCMTLRTPNYGNYGILLVLGNAGFCPSTVRRQLARSWT